MTSQRLTADLAFLGHMCFDEVIPFGGSPRVAPGSAVLCGALAAARIGTSVAVVTRMAPQDEEILTPMRQSGIAVHVIPADVTTYMRVVHTSADVDERQIDQLANAGPFSLSAIPALFVHQVHLAGITDQEFDLDFVRGMKARGYRLSADMQSWVRQVDPATRRVSFGDVANKAELARLLDIVKLDVVEARVLTETDDLERAAIVFEEWGCPEVVITRADGVLARVNGKTYWEPFSNRSVVGRTGRGDTTFAAYMARRLDHDPDESLRFAAALVSIKMEKAGPFDGTLADVLERMNTTAAR
ncbi:MAG: PfkB family carbohydrate kinase [Candidatus Limnocylindrales bacterium]